MYKRQGLQVPGDVDDDDALIATDKKKHLQQLGALVVERSLPDVYKRQCRNLGDLAFGRAASMSPVRMGKVMSQSL